VNARHPASLLAKHPAQLVTRFAKITKYPDSHRYAVAIFLSAVFSAVSFQDKFRWFPVFFLFPAGNAVKELVYIYRILLSWSIFKKGVIFYDISGFSNYPSE